MTRFLVAGDVVYLRTRTEDLIAEGELTLEEARATFELALADGDGWYDEEGSFLGEESGFTD